MWLRLVLYACLLPPVAVALGIGKRGGAASAMAIGVAACALAFLWPRARRALAAGYARSRTLRGVDAVLWNLAVAAIAGEILLAVASQLSNHPLLASPDAGTQARIAQERESLIAFYGVTGVNARGFNDTEWSADPGAAFRIVALGDSFAFGVVGYERNFLTLLESELSARLGRRVEVANLGMPNMQPGEYLQILLDDGLALHPDLVLLCLYTGNDFEPAPSRSPFDARNWRVVGFLSRLVRYAGEREFRTAPAPASGAPATGTNAPAFSEDGYLRIMEALVPLLRRESSARVERGLHETLAISDEIVARARPAPVVVAVLPSEVQVSAPLRERLLARLHLAEADLDLEHPDRVTRDHFAAQGVAVIDLLAALTVAEQSGSTYAPRNSHWNERGNEVAARSLADGLEPVVRELATAKDRSARDSATP
jgi:hypothetical protein